MGLAWKDRENGNILRKAPSPLCGKYGIPRIVPIGSVDIKGWIPFNYALKASRNGYFMSGDTKMNLKEIGVHFYIEDYQFERIWNKPELYTRILKDFGAVCSPDFSMWNNYSFACNIFNKFRNNWLGAYWQSSGISVIPSIGWNGEDSFNWCFDGDPVEGIISISSVGTQVSQRDKQDFMLGYKEAISQLKPAGILWHGHIPFEIKEDVINMNSLISTSRDRHF